MQQGQKPNRVSKTLKQERDNTALQECIANLHHLAHEMKYFELAHVLEDIFHSTKDSVKPASRKAG